MTEMAIPLQMPAFPLTQAEVAALQTDADWTGALSTRRQRIAVLEPRTDRESLAELGHLRAQEFLLAAMHTIRQRLAGPPNRRVYQTGVETVVGLLGAVSGPTLPASAIELVLRDVQLLIPFADPRDIRVEGTARVRGFAADDALKPLETVEPDSGCRPIWLFFSTATIGGPIRIPDLGRYPGGEVNLSQFTIGYGFTKNSLSVTFQGDVRLPLQLVRDADTSRTLGFGVRLPTDTSLGFKLDLVPVPWPSAGRAGVRVRLRPAIAGGTRNSRDRHMRAVLGRDPGPHPWRCP